MPNAVQKFKPINCGGRKRISFDSSVSGKKDRRRSELGKIRKSASVLSKIAGRKQKRRPKQIAKNKGED